MFAACLESSEQLLGLRDTEKPCLACLGAQRQKEPRAEILPLTARCSGWLSPVHVKNGSARDWTAAVHGLGKIFAGFGIEGRTCFIRNAISSPSDVTLGRSATPCLPHFWMTPSELRNIAV